MIVKIVGVVLGGFGWIFKLKKMRCYNKWFGFRVLENFIYEEFDFKDFLGESI